jgi:hypothetical protein
MKLTLASLATCALLGFSFVFESHEILGNGAGTQQDAIAREMSPEKLDCKGVVVKNGQRAGLIRSVGSRCYRQTGDAAPLLLDPKGDRQAAIFVGERFQCFEGSMVFELKGSTVKTGTTYTIRPVDGCHTLKAPAVSRRRGPVKSGVTSRGGLATHPPRRDRQ